MHRVQPRLFPAATAVPECSSREVEAFAASGNGSLLSYIINHRQHPSFDGPYAIAIVKLDEGPTMMSNIVDCEQTPEALMLDMPLTVAFEDNGDIAIPLFRPLGSAS